MLARIEGDKVQIGDSTVESDRFGAALGSRGQGVDTLRILLAPEHDDDALVKLVKAAERGEIHRLELRRDGQTIAIALNDPRDARLLVWNRGGQLRLHDLSAPNVAIGTGEPIVLDDAAAEAKLRERVASVCRDPECHVALELSPGDHAEIWRALALWQRATAPLPGVTNELTASPGAVLGATMVSGYLPPTLIQAVVRKNWGAFRQCYESGLTRSPELEGRVIVRFVIKRDGKVMLADSNTGTTLPDPKVVACVRTAFEKLEFPAPIDGIVTVAYPILLAPG